MSPPGWLLLVALLLALGCGKEAERPAKPSPLPAPSEHHKFPAREKTKR